MWNAPWPAKYSIALEIVLEKDNSLNALNFGILFGKKFIAEHRKNGHSYGNRFPDYVAKLIERLKIEKYIMTNQGKIEIFNEKWSKIL